MDSASRDRNLKAAYGIDQADFKLRDIFQNNLCAICGEPPNRNKFLHVDHDHETGTVRGLLCQKCNVGIGLLGDSEESLHRAWMYFHTHFDRSQQFREWKLAMSALCKQSFEDEELSASTKLLLDTQRKVGRAAREKALELAAERTAKRDIREFEAEEIRREKL